MPLSCMSCFAKLAKAGLPVIFTDSLPVSLAEGGNIEPLLEGISAVSLNKIGAELKKRGLCHLDGQGQGIKYLRYYHVVREGKDIYLFSNEDVNNDVNARISLKQTGECMIYDPWDNKCYVAEAKNGSFDLHLEKGNMLFVIFGENIPKDLPKFRHEVERMPLSLLFDIFVKNEGEQDYTLLAEKSPLFDITAPERLPSFSGTIRYTAKFEKVDDFSVLDLGQVGDTAEVWLNGKYLGARINAPYKFSMTEFLIEGTNELEILVRSNLGHRRRDFLSTFIQIPPTGILGDISLCKYSIN